MQFELITPPQHIAIFDDRQLADKASRITERGSDRRGIDDVQQTDSGFTTVLEPEIEREIRISFGLNNSVHGPIPLSW